MHSRTISIASFNSLHFYISMFDFINKITVSIVNTTNSGASSLSGVLCILHLLSSSDCMSYQIHQKTQRHIFIQCRLMFRQTITRFSDAKYESFFICLVNTSMVQSSISFHLSDNHQIMHYTTPAYLLFL